MSPALALSPGQSGTQGEFWPEFFSAPVDPFVADGLIASAVKRVEREARWISVSSLGFATSCAWD